VEKLVADRELRLELTEPAKMRLVDIGYEPAFGARPLKRAIVKAVQDPLAEELLAGGYPQGSTVKCDVDGDEGFKFIKG
jgi:ATP-dependent Clp protease ATP-binding subunit ClpB